MQKVKLAEALLRRKELEGKVKQLASIKEKDLFQIKSTRKNVAEGIDDIIASVPLLSASQVTNEYDWYARQLRLVDACIQQANWSCEVDLQDSVMGDYTPPDMKRSPQ